MLSVGVLMIYLTTALLAAMTQSAASTDLENRIQALLTQMTLEERVSLCHGFDSMHTNGIERLGIPKLRFSDGPHGVRETDGKTSTYFPTGIALASTWNPELARQMGVALGQEAKNFGVAMVLGPAVNMIRTPIGGRSFEYMSEDPYLTSRLAVRYVQGVQSEGVMACVKHFAANSVENERTTVDARVEERALQEIYTRVFRDTVLEGKTWSIMCAYNRLNGPYCAENETLLQTMLREQWAFPGFVVSDWGAVHSTIPTALHGVDLEMPGGNDNYLGAPLLKAVKEGKVPESAVNRKVRNYLRAVLSMGLDKPKPAYRADFKAHQSLAQKIAEEAIILMKNSGKILPLDANKLGSIAVIGPKANQLNHGGGGSSFVPIVEHEFSPLEGIKARLGNRVQINVAMGIDPRASGSEPIPGDVLFADESCVIPGLKARYEGGGKVLERTDAAIDFDWEGKGPGNGLPDDEFKAEWTGFLKPKVSGKYRIGTSSDDGSHLWLDGKMVVDNGGEHGVESRFATIELEAGRVYRLRADFTEARGSAVMQLVWTRETRDMTPMMQEAVEAARKSDVAIVFAGTTHAWDTEGNDKPDLSLFGNQERLIKEVAAVNPRTIVVLVNGSAVETDGWSAQTPGIVEMWYAGMEGGTAIAKVLFGDTNPSGKLPISFPRKLADSSAHAKGDIPWSKGVLNYSEGMEIGYRWFAGHKIAPSFPFGHGLSYTTFEYQSASTETSTGAAICHVKIKNTGSRDGKETVQVYLRPVKVSVFRPERELRGFAKVELQPGEQKTISIPLDPWAFSVWDVASKKWVLAPGDYEVLVGSSSADIRLKQSIKVK